MAGKLIIPTKLWITDELDVVQVNVTNNSVVSSIIPKIYQCDVNYLRLYHQIISYHEFMILCSSAQVLDLYQVAVSNDNDTVFSFKKLFEQLTQLKEIYYTFTTSSNNTAKVDFKELWNIPHCANYDHFCLYNIPEDFDIDGFYPFMKKNKKTRVNLCFSDEISEEYKARLEAFIDEIIDAKDHGYKPPYISFLGNNQEKFNKLHRLHLK
uniref:Uncharacterized protein n=1 Tax=Panagrolaimus superbus TaxID=310955 RepID=A0A914YLT4_9BILA